MRICKNCNVEMMENSRMYMTSHVTGDSVPLRSMIKIEKEPTLIQEKLGLIVSSELTRNLNTAVCPNCGLVENYLNKNALDDVKQIIQK